jgi:aldehyde:ferredoxin oxidoreductase
MPDILTIDLTGRTSTRTPLPEAFRGLGGRGLTAAITTDRMAPTADPLGPEGVLVFAPGLLGGTALPNSGRLSVGGKSPLTGTIKEANAGGAAGRKLSRLGLAAVVLEGVAELPTVLQITDRGVFFDAAGDLWGRGNYATVEALAARYPGCGLATIGPAGEMGCRAASVTVATPDQRLRTAARGGLGAVLGAKRVKALVIDDGGAPAPQAAEPERFQAACGALAKGIAASPFSQGFQALGTAMLVNMVNELGALPTRNYSQGRFEGAAAISGEALAGIMGSRQGAATKHRCMEGCVIHCSQVYTDPAGEEITSGFEYETLVLVGSNCAIDDPDAIARIDRACDDLGLDTIETGAAVGVAMEGGQIPWGDGAGVLSVLRSLPAGDALARTLADGCVAAGKAFGVGRVPAVKGQSMAAYDPRVLKATGVTYATTPMGADHTAGVVLPDPSNPAYDVTSPEGQHAVSEQVQAFFMAVDTLGLCLFAALPLLGDPGLAGKLVEAASAFTGEPLGEGYLGALGQRVAALEKSFNREAGFGPADDRLPRFMAREPLSPHGLVWDVADADLDRVFSGAGAAAGG